MNLRLIRDRRGYSLTFWTIFFGFILIPILALSIELGRYVYARAEVAKAADAAALAAAAEINQRVFEETGDLQPTGKTWANAQVFALPFNASLPSEGSFHLCPKLFYDLYWRKCGHESSH